MIIIIIKRINQLKFLLNKLNKYEKLLYIDYFCDNDFKFKIKWKIKNLDFFIYLFLFN